VTASALETALLVRAVIGLGLIDLALWLG